MRAACRPLLPAPLRQCSASGPPPARQHLPRDVASQRQIIVRKRAVPREWDRDRAECGGDEGSEEGDSRKASENAHTPGASRAGLAWTGTESRWIKVED